MQNGPQFQLVFTAGPEHIDELSHVSNLVYMDWVLRAARAHSDQAGWTAERYLDKGSVFVVRRHEIDYLRPAKQGNEICVTTWIESWKAATCIRRTDITHKSGAIVYARASTQWAYFDLRSERPTRIPDDVRGAFAG